MSNVVVEQLYSGRDINPDEKKVLEKYYKKFLQETGYPLEKELRKIMKSSGSQKPLDNLWSLLDIRHIQILKRDTREYNKMVKHREEYNYEMDLTTFEPNPINHIDCWMCDFRIDEYKLSCKNNPDRMKEEGIPKEIVFVIHTCEKMVEHKFEGTYPYDTLLKYYKKYNQVKDYIRIGGLYLKLFSMKETKRVEKQIKEINEIIENNSSV